MRSINLLWLLLVDESSMCLLRPCGLYSMRNPASAPTSSETKLTTAMLVSVKYGWAGRSVPHSLAMRTPLSTVHPSYISTWSLEQSLEPSNRRRTTVSFITFPANNEKDKQRENQTLCMGTSTLRTITIKFNVLLFKFEKFKTSNMVDYTGCPWQD